MSYPEIVVMSLGVLYVGFMYVCKVTRTHIHENGHVQRYVSVVQALPTSVLDGRLFSYY